jgi:hypothetical protein
VFVSDNIQTSRRTGAQLTSVEFLGDAAVLLFPVDWPEPFGLVMIEAMACGTPVLAFRCGSIPEIIEDGVTGKVVDREEEAVTVLPAILSYDRRAVRQRFEDRFAATRMAKDYVSTYRQLLGMQTFNGNTRSPRPRQLDLNGGNGLVPTLIEKPIPTLLGAASDGAPLRFSKVSSIVSTQSLMQC